jgi:hypothetical protein
MIVGTADATLLDVNLPSIQTSFHSESAEIWVLSKVY